nr:hypothetical protein [Tanacetum cinerariifolium]
MTSFGYRLNPRYAIKECSSCGTLYTRDCSFSKGNVEDKILVPKPPKNCARCARCGHPVDGPYCQGCTFLRKKLEEDLVTHFQGFQNTSKSSDDSSNVVNIPLEPFVVKQDHGSFVDKIICGLNKAPDSPHLHTFLPNQFHCFHCKDALGDGEAWQRCTCKRCGSGLSNGLCLIVEIIIILQMIPQVFLQILHTILHTLMNIALSVCQPMNQNFYNSNSSGFDQTQPLQFPVIHPPPQETSIEILHDQENELVEYINTPGWNRPAFYNNGDDDDVDYTIAITPVLSTEEPDNSLSMRDEHLDTILSMESDEVIKTSVEDLVPILSESEGIPDTMCDVHLVNNPTPLEAKDHFEIVINSNDDYSSSDDDSLYYENIEYVEASPHDYELVSLEVEKIVILEDEEIEDDNLREKLLKQYHYSSDISPLEYEAFSFYDDHIEEISSGSTTTQSDISLPKYDSFIFDLRMISFLLPIGVTLLMRSSAMNAHIISPPEYDCFYFRNFPDPGELISSLNSGIRENLSSTTRVNLPIEDDHSPLLAYVVWIFLVYLTYPVILPHLHSFGKEDTIFDPGITINRFYSSNPGLSHRCGTFKKFNTHRSHLNESPMEMLFSTLFLMDQ